MDEFLHHFEIIGNHCLLVFSSESLFQGFLGGAGFRPSTVCCFKHGGWAPEAEQFIDKLQPSKRSDILEALLA